MSKPGDIAIVSGARTPFGRYCGKLKDFTAQELGAVAAKAAIERAGIDAKEFDHAVFGNAQQTSGDALYGARHVGLRAGLPIETPALTVNRLCGSGMQAIVSAAQMIQTDEAKIALAGGMEAMSQAPFVIRGRDGFTLAPGGKLEDSLMVPLSFTASSRASRGRRRMNSRCARSRRPTRPIKKDAFRKSWCRCGCAMPRARRREKCWRRTITAVRRPRWKD
jgi:acetyl-CoA acetyltransferase